MGSSSGWGVGADVGNAGRKVSGGGGADRYFFSN